MSHPWKDLLIWQRAHELVLKVYMITKSFPDEERFCLTQQIRRSVISVAANIVEGKSKKTNKEFCAYLYNSRGSLEETRYHLLIAKDLGYIRQSDYEIAEKLMTEVSYLLNKLIKSASK